MLVSRYLVRPKLLSGAQSGQISVRSTARLNGALPSLQTPSYDMESHWGISSFCTFGGGGIYHKYETPRVPAFSLKL